MFITRWEVARLISSPTNFDLFCNSSNQRLDEFLIADEVGLGKTISAIYIWKELQARAGARRLLIICPAVLRDKWKLELRNRFSIEAQIVDAATLEGTWKTRGVIA